MVRDKARKADVRERKAQTGDAYNVARRALDDEYIQQLADEAEAGYDVDRLVPRKIMPL